MRHSKVREGPINTAALSPTVLCDVDAAIRRRFTSTRLPSRSGSSTRTRIWRTSRVAQWRRNLGVADRGLPCNDGYAGIRPGGRVASDPWTDWTDPRLWTVTCARARAHAIRSIRGIRPMRPFVPVYASKRPGREAAVIELSSCPLVRSPFPRTPDREPVNGFVGRRSADPSPPP
jgi:hypothetical protein